MPRTRLSLAAAAITLALTGTGTALMAQRTGPYGPGWGEPRWGEPRWGEGRDAERSLRRERAAREGKVDVAQFRAAGDVALALGHGAIAVVRPADESAAPDSRISATFEAAVENQLAGAGYDTLGSATGGQIAEVRIVRAEAEPAEQKGKPLSGEMVVGVSNHGSMIGGALHYDGTKPRAALISTRLETRIRDRVSGQVLWEGRAEMLTRAGDDRWGDQAIASKLAAALFDGFPTRTGEPLAAR
ncbi:MAG: hypothetical protein RL339_194 [Pseudomonadota bacterium]|jgi:hypothetical protein